MQGFSVRATLVVAELMSALRMSPMLGHPTRKVPSQLDGALTIAILAVAGVASISLFALKGVLDQVPDVINSASRAREAWHRFKNTGDEQPSPPQVTQLPTLPTDDEDEEQPPAAA